MYSEKLYYNNSYRTNFVSSVQEVEEKSDRILLNLKETYFYPTSGGQPNDLGVLKINEKEYDLIDVEKSADDSAVWHHIQRDPEAEVPKVGDQVHGEIDWTRRFDHMQQHSGQHLLSAILEQEYEIQTLSVHIGAEMCTFDLDKVIDSRDILDEWERKFAKIVAENRPMTVTYRDVEEGEAYAGGRVRLVLIKDLDSNPCCGTHCSSTGEIGPLVIKFSQKFRKGSRVSYYIGHRAVYYTQELGRAVGSITSLLKANVGSLPGLVDQLVKSNKQLQKDNAQTLAALGEARAQLKFLNQQTDETDGLKKITIEKDVIGDLEASMAKAVAVMSKCVFVAVSSAPPHKVILGVSQDTGLNAATAIKTINQSHNGKGGGAPGLASCSLQSPASAAEVFGALFSA